MSTYSDPRYDVVKVADHFVEGIIAFRKSLGDTETAAAIMAHADLFRYQGHPALADELEDRARAIRS